MREITHNTVSRVGLIAGIFAIVLFSAPAAHAALTDSSQLSQQITAGVLGTSIRTSAGAEVASPSFSMGSVVASTSQQTATGTFGDNNQRITVDNPNASNTGWVLSLAATAAGSATWSNGTATYPFNSTAPLGQMTINPAAGTLFQTIGTATGITKGTSTAFSAALPITILNAGATSDDVWNGYITGIGVTQTIPAGTPVGTYTISLTQTVAAQ